MRQNRTPKYILQKTTSQLTKPTPSAQVITRTHVTGNKLVQR